MSPGRAHPNNGPHSRNVPTGGSAQPGEPAAPARPENRQRTGADWDLTDVLPDPPPWHVQAACRGAGSRLFFPHTDDHRPASQRRYKFGLTYCRTCPVVAECLAAGEAEVFGLWGGLTPTERAGRRAKAG